MISQCGDNMRGLSQIATTHMQAFFECTVHSGSRGYVHRTVLFDGLQSAKAFQQGVSLFGGEGAFGRVNGARRILCASALAQAEHGGSLNFSAYRQGRDRQVGCPTVSQAVCRLCLTGLL